MLVTIVVAVDFVRPTATDDTQTDVISSVVAHLADSVVDTTVAEVDDCEGHDEDSYTQSQDR